MDEQYYYYYCEEHNGVVEQIGKTKKECPVCYSKKPYFYLITLGSLYKVVLDIEERVKRLEDA